MIEFGELVNEVGSLGRVGGMDQVVDRRTFTRRGTADVDAREVAFLEKLPHSLRISRYPRQEDKHRFIHAVAALPGGQEQAGREATDVEGEVAASGLVEIVNVIVDDVVSGFKSAVILAMDIAHQVELCPAAHEHGH